MTKIIFEHVSARDKSGSHLDGVSMIIEDGDYVAVLGPTGAGPSELLKVVAGLIPLTSGKLIFDHKEVTTLPPEDRYVGMIFEQFNLFPHLSVIDNILYGPRMRRMDLNERRKVAEEIISMVRLDGRENAVSRELSGGMMQRVGIARAIVAGAKILLLDQPYRALDAKIRAEMRLEIRNLVKGLKLTAIHSTHETEEAMLVADKIAIFNNGKLEQFGTPEEVFNNPTSEFVATFLAETNVWDIDNINETSIEVGSLNIKYNPNSYSGEYSRIGVRQHAIDIFVSEDDIPSSWNRFEGIITKVRLLGEFIRITVNVDGTTVVIRELLNPTLEHLSKMIGTKIWIAFSINEVKLFK